MAQPTLIVQGQHITVHAECGSGPGYRWQRGTTNDGSLCHICLISKPRGLNPREVMSVTSGAQSLPTQFIQRLVAAEEFDQHFVGIVREEPEYPSLDRALAHGPLPDQQVAQILTKLVEAIIIAADFPYGHGHLQPSSILVDHGQRFRLVNPWLHWLMTSARFDLAPHDASAVHWVDPECRSSVQRGDILADCYSACAIGYTLLTGQVPNPTSGSVANPRTFKPNCHPELAVTIMQGLDVNRQRRLRSPQDLLRALRACQFEQQFDPDDLNPDPSIFAKPAPRHLTGAAFQTAELQPDVTTKLGTLTPKRPIKASDPRPAHNGRTIGPSGRDSSSGRARARIASKPRASREPGKVAHKGGTSSSTSSKIPAWSIIIIASCACLSIVIPLIVISGESANQTSPRETTHEQMQIKVETIDQTESTRTTVPQIVTTTVNDSVNIKPSTSEPDHRPELEKKSTVAVAVAIAETTPPVPKRSNHRPTAPLKASQLTNTPISNTVRAQDTEIFLISHDGQALNPQSSWSSGTNINGVSLWRTADLTYDGWRENKEYRTISTDDPLEFTFHAQAETPYYIWILARIGVHYKDTRDQRDALAAEFITPIAFVSKPHQEGLSPNATQQFIVEGWGTRSKFTWASGNSNGKVGPEDKNPTVVQFQKPGLQVLHIYQDEGPLQIAAIMISTTQQRRPDPVLPK